MSRLSVRVTANSDQIIPKLQTVFCAPTVIALKDRYDELFRAIKQLRKEKVLSVHVK
jgi:hypothetical protein